MKVTIILIKSWKYNKIKHHVYACLNPSRVSRYILLVMYCSIVGPHYMYMQSWACTIYLLNVSLIMGRMYSRFISVLFWFWINNRQNLWNVVLGGWVVVRCGGLVLMYTQPRIEAGDSFSINSFLWESIPLKNGPWNERMFKLGSVWWEMIRFELVCWSGSWIIKC